jgi:hypothetical protein
MMHGLVKILRLMHSLNEPEFICKKLIIAQRTLCLKIFVKKSEFIELVALVVRLVKRIGRLESYVLLAVKLPVEPHI